jgi:RNA polymerase sigma factor (TIGR02999 family)
MDITELLHRASSGDAEAEHELIPLVYRELKRLASGHLKRDWNTTLNATALVHEAFLRMAVSNQPKFEDRTHFFGIASRVMRNVLVDLVRQTRALKRGGAALTVHLEDLGDFGTAPEGILLDLDRALDRLAESYAREAKIIEMRYFAGMSLEEISVSLSISVSTAQRDLRFAQAWLHRELASGSPPNNS